jgi:exodeoxyribonuclease VII small subunit
MAEQNGRKFEEELADLEALVTLIDSGELSLEDSINMFERGVGLVRSLNQKLDEVDRRVEVLTRSAQGQLKVVLYQNENGAEEARDESADDDDDSL